MRSPELKDFIRRHSYLFWYIPEDKKEDISDEYLVETILNYGGLDDFKELKDLLGKDYMSKVFLGLEGRKKLNYFPEVYNYFNLYFTRHAR